MTLVIVQYSELIRSSTSSSIRALTVALNLWISYLCKIVPNINKMKRRRY